MDLNALSNVAQGLAVIFAVVLGVMQVNEIRSQRRRETARTPEHRVDLVAGRYGGSGCVYLHSPS